MNSQNHDQTIYPDAKYPDANFWNKLAARYAAKLVKNPQAYQYKLEKTQTCLKPDMNILEVACGTGTTALKHAPLVKHIRAIDFSDQMIEIARKKAVDQQIHNVSFEQLSIDDLKPDDGPYHAIMAHSILHLVRNPKDTIAKLSGLLIPGGVLVSSTVCIADSLPLLGLIAPAGRFFGLLPIVSSFGQKQLEQYLGSASLDIEHRWKPESGKSVFIIARKTQTNTAHTDNANSE